MTEAMPARRRDEESDWHDLVAAACQTCGCTCYEAADEPAIVWEPGRSWDDACLDRGCHCHVEPLIGVRRT